ncbi:hypothetical protein BOX15_Mlig024438g2 [Macrostomum lignano]|uniref:Protein kinase domain-containing protein n=1 Tax=Macrostomum lignano TaxID=282301 RepID=A0A267DJB5_9PLAT|nr:hypothetical protein BOX15_Mlig024438g2 [Macrostomum lignano]
MDSGQRQQVQELQQALMQLAALFGVSADDLQSVTSMSSSVKGLMEAAAVGNRQQCRSLVSKAGGPNARGNKGIVALHVAAHEGQLEVMKELLELGADIEAVDEDGDTPLIMAAMNRQDDAADLLIEKGANVRHLNNKGLSAADVALAKRNLNMVYSLEGVSHCLQYDSDIHEKTLTSAAQEGNTRVIEFWLEHSPERRAYNRQLGQKRTIAFIAALNGHLDIIELLESKRADFELTDDRGNTPLFCAAQNDHFEVVQFLLDKRCNVNHENCNRRTPIFSAVNNGHEDIVSLLIRHGARVDHEDEDGRTPLECAVKQGSLPVFQMLVEAGADPKHVNSRGYDLAMGAADSSNLEILKELRKLGVSLTRVNTRNGETALLGACQVGPDEVVKYLLKEGSEKNHKNRRGISPALRAAYNGLTDVVSVLANAGANMDIADNDGDTPILCAAQQGNQEMVELLHGLGCKVSAKNNRGRTLVWFAAKSGNLELVEFLKDIGAPMDAPDANGNTPLMIAVMDGSNPDLVSYLVRCGCSVRKQNQKGENAEALAKKANQRAILTVLTETKREPGAREKMTESGFLRRSRPQPPKPEIDQEPIYPGAGLDASFKRWNIMCEDDGSKKPIGEGGFGKVYKAITDKHQFVAVKVVQLRGLMSEQTTRIVSQEKKGIEILSGLKHPNILVFLKCEQAPNGDFCIFTELISGVSLCDLMRRQKQPFEEAGICKFSRQICDALNFLHSRKVLHRDIKCSNIMLSNEGIIKLIDFGLAKEIFTTTVAYSSSSQCGTLCFMAPELLDCSADRVIYSTKSDVWAFGCTVYEMACILPPNCRLPQGLMINAIVSKPMPDLPSKASRNLRDFYAKCVIKDPSTRPSMEGLLRHPFLAGR